jgi:hypothetical protein
MSETLVINGADTNHEEERALAQASIGNIEFVQGKDIENSPMDFLSKNRGRRIAFWKYLSGFTTQEVIRFLISCAATSVDDGILIFEDSSNYRIQRIVVKSAECVGLACLSSDTDGLVRFHVFRDSKSDGSLYADGSFLARSMGFSVPMIDEEALLGQVSEHLSRGEGFSFVRFNHCEPRVLGYDKFYYDKDLDVTFDIQWGRTNISRSERKYLSYLLEQSLSSANVVGVPRFNNEITTRLHVLENSFYTLASLLGTLPETVQFCNVNAHFKLGKSQQIFDIISKADRVFLITGRNISDAMIRKTGNDNITLIKIPQESRFVTEQSLIEHFPDAMKTIEDRLVSEIEPGDLILVGAGILGKHYCRIAKENSGVALDLGSLFDAWAGVNTRGSGFPPEMSLDYRP